MKTNLLLKTIRGTSYEKYTIKGEPDKHIYYDIFRVRKNGYEIWLESWNIAYLSVISVPSINIRIIHDEYQYSERYFIGAHCSFTIKDLDDAMLRAKEAIERFINGLEKTSDMESYLSISEGISHSYINEQNHCFKTLLPFELPWVPLK